MCGGLAVTLAQGQTHAAGQAGGPPSPSKVQAEPAPVGLDDMLLPQDGWATEAPCRPAPVLDVADPAPVPRVPLSARLRAWDDSTRRNAQLQIELPRGASDAACALAREFEASWSAGRYEAAILLLETLETGGTPVAVGASWRTPLPAGNGLRDFADVRIGTRTGGALAKLDYDRTSGKLFAVVRWASDNGWALYQSANDGTTWGETYFWFAGAGEQAVDVDMAVVGAYVYTGYVPSNVAHEARIRRSLVSTGASDAAYGFQVVLDTSPNTVAEVAVESNADSSQNRVYYALRQSDNAVRWAWDVSTDGATFDEVSPAGASARGGLDMHWNAAYTTWYVFLSYVGTDSQVHVLRKSGAAWENLVVDTTFTGSHDRTAVSAWADTVICGFEEEYSNGQGIKYVISYNGADTWNLGNLAVPNAGEGAYQMVDITARGGQGTAAVYTHEVGEPDDVLIQYRHGYAPGAWQAPLRVNDFDVTTGTWTALNWTPTDTLNSRELSYGLVYFSGGIPYFYRFQWRPGDMNCDGYVDFDDINPFVTALVSQQGYESRYPDCVWLNGDIDGSGAVNFDDINPFVACLVNGECP
jgi:hypothetical protein